MDCVKGDKRFVKLAQDVWMRKIDLMSPQRN